MQAHDWFVVDARAPAVRENDEVLRRHDVKVDVDAEPVRGCQ